MQKQVRIEVSARHMHLTQCDLEQLFGEGYELEVEKELSQEGDFASAAKVALEGPKRKLENVRIIGPCRSHTQVEISKTDSYYLGVSVPVRLSGKIIGSGSIKVIGPKGKLNLKEGLIVAKRHIHLSPEQARELKVSNGQNIKVAVEGPRALIFDEVEARVKEGYDQSIHLDTDEGNAAGIEGEATGLVIVE